MNESRCGKPNAKLLPSINCSRDNSLRFFLSNRVLATDMLRAHLFVFVSAFDGIIAAVFSLLFSPLWLFFLPLAVLAPGFQVEKRFIVACMFVRNESTTQNGDDDGYECSSAE